jgi:hypothetical protein
METIRSLKRCILKYKQEDVLDKNRSMDNVQKHNICTPIQWLPEAVSSGLGREADHSPPLSVEVKNGGAITPLTIRLHGVLLN